MFEYRIKIEGMEELRKKLGEMVGADYKNQLRRTMEISAGMVKTKARDLVPVDTGALRRSIREQVRSGFGTIEGVVEPLEPYGAAVEFGARPHFPPIGALKRWAEKRGMNPFLVARAISRKGTKARPYMFPALEQMKDRIVEAFRKAIDFLLSK